MASKPSSISCRLKLLMKYEFFLVGKITTEIPLCYTSYDEIVVQLSAASVLSRGYDSKAGLICLQGYQLRHTCLWYMYSY